MSVVATHEVQLVGEDERGLLVRSRLSERLEDVTRGRLTVLAAPAGYGKTVAVDHWAARRREESLAIVRLGLADGHAQVTIRRTSAGAAMRSLGGSPAVPNQSTATMDGPSVVHFLSDLSRAGVGIVVIDRLDARRDDELVGAVARLITRAPSDLRLLLTHRGGLPVGLKGAAADAVTTVLDASELAFTYDEAQLLVHRVSGLQLTESETCELMTRTEGWPFAINVAAIALRRSQDPGVVIDGITADFRHIASFLREEVIDREPAIVRRFLVRTSVLDPLSGPSCDAVTGERTGHAMLRLLEQRGLFMRRSSPGSSEYTLHPIFRQLLRRELQVAALGAESELLHLAASSALHDGDPNTAIRHLVEAEDWDGVLDVIDRFGRAMFERGEPHTVLGWLDTLPPGYPTEPTARRKMAMRRAFVHTMLGQPRRAEHELRIAPITSLTPGERLVVETLRCTWAFMGATSATVLSASDFVLTTIRGVPPEEIPDILSLTSPASLAAIAIGGRARALWQEGDVESSRRLFRDLADRSDAYPPWRVHAIAGLALLEAWAGNPSLAFGHARTALRLAKSYGLDRHPAGLDARLAAAHVLRVRGQFDKAIALLDDADTIASHTHRPVTLSVSALERALLHLAAQEPRLGLQAIVQNRATGEPAPPPVVDRRLRAAEISLLIAAGQIAKAESVLSAALAEHGGAERADVHGEVTDQCRPRDPSLAAAAVAVAVARRDLATAREALDAWEPIAGTGHDRLAFALWETIIEFESGHRRQALRHATTLAEHARAQRNLTLFLDAGEPGLRLLRALANIAPSKHTAEMLRRVDQATPDGAEVRLSERELEVVRYLPSPLSNADIAERLYVSLNTLKTHLRAIYRKLGVNDRRDAIRRAQELGIA